MRSHTLAKTLVLVLTMFPNAAHDDLADMMSQASAWLLYANIHTVQICNAFTGRPFDT